MKIINKKLISREDFISVIDNKFTFRGNEFNFIGFNAYYLQSEAAKGNNHIVDEVMRAAVNIGAKVIRTWGFYESDSPENKIAIRFEPDKYNETALEALDYVLHKARENNIKLIIPLANYWADFGGVPQYIKWAQKYLHKRFGKFNEDDFFLNDEIKNWYKKYIEKILNRTNSYNSVQYKDDATIFAFELMNEAEIPKENYRVVLNWYDEMSNFIRTKDRNHLITTGEIGFDFLKDRYPDFEQHNPERKFLLNGYKGTSYFENLKLPNIDFGSYHLYPEGWGLSTEAAKAWITDHHQIAEKIGKPVLLGEFGIKNNSKSGVYKDWLNTLFTTKNRSALVWHFLHKDVQNSDGYGFDLDNTDVIDVLKEYSEKLEQPVQIKNQDEEIVVYQNRPNPVNILTSIKFSLPKDDYILLEFHNSMGNKILTLDEGFKQKGIHEITLSFENTDLASGVYYYSMKIGAFMKTKKMIFIK